MSQKVQTHTPRRTKPVRWLTVTAMLSAVATVLMYINFNVPLMPGFIKLDLSELPALIAAFAMGPLSGVTVCLIKNLINVMVSTTGGVGELSNFILGASFVLIAGLAYKRMGGRKGALIGSLCGAAFMAIVSVFSNYYIVYPVYTVFMPMDTILDMYKAINPNVGNLWDALLWFNMPFTFIKGMLSVIITFLIYKKISPVLKGRH